MKRILIISGIYIFVYLLIKGYKNRKEIIDFLRLGMSNEQINNAKLITQAFNKAGVYNPFFIGGVLTVVYKESNLIPRSEIGYSSTSNQRIREIFPSALKVLTDDELSTLKKDDAKFFNRVYGNRFGNILSGDGFKYRGRGFNQLTFRDNYKYYGNKIGVDILKNPDLVNTPEVAAKIVAEFFKRYTSDTINTPNLGFVKAYQVNAGTGTNINTSFHKGVIEKYLPDSVNFYTLAKTFKP